MGFGHTNAVEDRDSEGKADRGFIAGTLLDPIEKGFSKMGQFVENLFGGKDN